MLSNLLSNAIKFTPEDGTVTCARGRATDRSRHRGYGARDRSRKISRTCSIDFGDPGIEGEGTGLVYIARGVVEAHGGRVWAVFSSRSDLHLHVAARAAPRLTAHGRDHLHCRTTGQIRLSHIIEHEGETLRGG